MSSDIKLPKAYGGCTCRCHHTPMLHVVACCRPPADHPDAKIINEMLTGNPARVMQKHFEQHYEKTPESDKRFDEWAAYCDEVVTVNEYRSSHYRK